MKSSAARVGKPLLPEAPADGARPRPWPGELGRRLAYLWWFKALGTTAFMTAFFAAYLHLLHFPVYPVTVMPLTAIDRAVGFQPWALAAYATLWIYVALPPALAPTLPRLFSYGWHIGALCVAGIVVFVFWPTAVPPADVDWGRYPGYALLKGIDAGGNACPSLHVATALYSAIWLAAELRAMAAPGWLRTLSWLWCALIVFSTLATKQHVSIDVAAGTALALLAAALSPGLRRLRPARVAARP